MDDRGAGERPAPGLARKSDVLGDLLGLDQALDGVRGEDDLLEHALARDPCVVGLPR